VNEQKLKQTLNELKVFLGELVDNAAGPGAGNSIADVVATLISPEGTLHLGPESGPRYAHSIRNLYGALSDEEKSRLSLLHLEDRVKTAVFEVLDLGKIRFPDREGRISRGIDRLRAALQQRPCPWVVTLRVQGATGDGLPMRLGNVEFVTGDDDILRQLRDLADVTPQDVGVRWGDGRTQRQRWHDEINGEFKDSVLARVTIEAVDAAAARELAVTEVRRTLDIINFFAARILPAGMWVHLAGEAVADTFLIVSQPVRKPTKIRVTKHRSQREGRATSDVHDGAAPVGAVAADFWVAPAGVLAPFAIGHLSKVRTGPGWDGVDAILSSGKPTADDVRVLTACMWAGRGSTARRPEEAFLFFAVAVETLLLGGVYRDEITYRLKLRAAWLLGDDSATRSAIFSQMGELYGRRSAIVHCGTLSVTSMELGGIRLLAFAALDRVLGMTQVWRNSAPPAVGEKSRLNDWFEGRLLGSADQSPLLSDNTDGGIAGV